MIHIFVTMNVRAALARSTRPDAKIALFYCLLLLVNLVIGNRAPAQTFASVYDFNATPGSYPYTNSDGAIPQAGLVLSGNTLFGTASGGGNSGNGTLFKVNADGTSFANLHSFSPSGSATNNDGSGPLAGLILSENALYGSANLGGAFGNGTLFKVNDDGSGFVILHNFNGADGSDLVSGLILSNRILYGTAFSGGASGKGTLFRLNTDGSGFAVLHQFTITDYSGRNSDGANPQGGLVLSGNILYGTATAGGAASSGTIFAINTDGTGFTTLHNFTPLSSNPWTNTDGACPMTGMLLVGDTLYGTASQGGNFGKGALFRLKINGAGFTTLHHFGGSPNDGASPSALLLSGDTLYGTATSGGKSNSGTAFKLNIDGSDFTTLHEFTAVSTYASPNADGSFPIGQLVHSGDTLYGTAAYGGKSGNGTVFAISFGAPKLTIVPSGANVILHWPTNDVAAILQSTTELGSSASWSAVSEPPVVIEGQNSVTIPISGTKRYFRLSQ